MEEIIFLKRFQKHGFIEKSVIALGISYLTLSKDNIEIIYDFENDICSDKPGFKIVIFYDNKIIFDGYVKKYAQVANIIEEYHSNY